MEKTYLTDANTLIYAAKEQRGEIALWLKQSKPYVTDVSERECLHDWRDINRSENKAEKQFLENFFLEAKREGRYIQTNKQEKINLYETRAQKLQSYGIKKDDAYIASVAEQKGLFLVTADNRRNFAPRLEKLNQQGDGNFKVKAYEYENRNQTFKQWNQEYKKSITAELAMKRHLQKSQSQTNQKTNYRKR